MFRRHVVSRGAQCPEDDMERNVGESKLFKGVQVICSITALKLKTNFEHTCSFKMRFNLVVTQLARPFIGIYFTVRDVRQNLLVQGDILAPSQHI